MSQHECNATDLMNLGAYLICLRNPSQYSLKAYINVANDLVSLAKQMGFQSTVNAMKPVLSELEQLSGHKYGDLHFGDAVPRFSSTANSIGHVLHGEADQRSVILTGEVPPPELAQLKNLQARQKLILHDLELCFKSRLSRPAIVLTWALGYDIVRSWVYSDANRLAAFNAQYSDGPIVDYDDFYSVNERAFLNICKKAQGALKDFTENTHNALIGLLIDRNRFAHANDSEATISRARVFAEKMVEIVTGPPFA